MSVSAPPAEASERHRPPWWRDVRVIRVVLQVAFVVAVVGVLWWLFSNLTSNLRTLGIRRDFGFLDQSAGFTIIGSDFRSTQSIRDALTVGFGNTLKVAIPGVVVAMILGLIVGVARLSTNWLVRRTAGIYVEVLRNVPPLVLITFFYLGVITQLPGINDSIAPPGLGIYNNRGLWVPWLRIDEGATGFMVGLVIALVVALAVAVWRTRRFDATGQPHHRVLWFLGVFVGISFLLWLAMGQPTEWSVPTQEGRLVEGGLQLFPEYGALLIALFLYTAAFIAEIIRGSIQSVHKGQAEAAMAVGLSWFDRLRHVILPQALRVAAPPTGNEFLNLSKNVSLGVAIAYPELLRIARQAIGNGHPAPQLVFIALGGYLALSFSWAIVTNIANRRLQLVER